MESPFLPVLKALSDPIRWQIVEVLARGPQTTGHLAEVFPQSRFGVMKHLEVLVAAGLVTFEKRGRERWNYLNPVPLARMVEALTRPLDRDWMARLLALQRAVEPKETPMTVPQMIDIRQDIRLAAPPERVFSVMTQEIDLWWTAPYRMTEGGRVTLDLRIGGELREEAPSGHVAVWGRVEEVAPGRLLVLSGTIGMESAVAGRVRIALAAEAGGTVLTLSHRAMGPLADGAGQRYAAGWDDLLGTRLRARVEAA